MREEIEIKGGKKEIETFKKCMRYRWLWKMLANRWEWKMWNARSLWMTMGFVAFLLLTGCGTTKIISTPVHSAGVQQWTSEGRSLDVGEVFVPIAGSGSRGRTVFLNVAIDFDGNATYGAYSGSAGNQEEWVLQNVPVHVPGGDFHYQGAFFALTDDGAKSGTYTADVWVTNAPIVSAAYGKGTLPTKFTMETFVRNAQPLSDLGPTGGGANEKESRFTIENRGMDKVLYFGPGESKEGKTRKLPKLKKQPNGSRECFITSVAMSMYWLEKTNPKMFGKPLPKDINDLLTKMKETDEWRNHNIIRWGKLDAFKKVIFSEYEANVEIHEWNGEEDAYTWIKNEFNKGQDVEVSMGYKPASSNRGHTVIVTGWTEKNNKKSFKGVDPLEPTKKGKQFDKNIKVTGTDVDYPSRNGTYIREINAESPKKK